MFIVTVLNLLILIDFLPTIQECSHWLILLEIRVSVTKSDVNNGFSLLIP